MWDKRTDSDHVWIQFFHEACLLQGVPKSGKESQP